MSNDRSALLIRGVVLVRFSIAFQCVKNLHWYLTYHSNEEKQMHEIMFKSIVTFDLKSSYFLIASLPLLPIHAGGVKIHLSSVPSLVKSF